MCRLCTGRKYDDSYIYENEKTFGVFGSTESLSAIAELILLKVKLHQSLSATLTDVLVVAKMNI